MTLDPLVVFGAIGSILGTVLGAGIKGIWVFGRELTAANADTAEMTKDRDFWRGIALEGLKTADQAVSVAKKSSRDV